MKHFNAIIIGSGVAGLNAALRLAEKNLRVLIVTKKNLAESNTRYAQGGIAAALSHTDSFQKHKKDTLKAGCFHNNKKAVDFLVKNGPAAIKRLLELGVHFTKKNGGSSGDLSLTREGGHTERRVAFVSDYTGLDIEKTLVKYVKKNPNITTYENTFAAGLLVRRKTCFGVRILRSQAKPHAKFKNIFAEIIVLATGGIGQVYQNTTNPAIATADGIALAANAGCAFRDMEFVQFHPTALNKKGKPHFMISESARGEGAVLINKKGWRFMQNIHPLAELAPRDIVSLAIFEEQRRTPVYLDFRNQKPSYIKKRFPQVYKTLKKYGVDITKNPVPIAPAAHYLCGGVKTDLRGRTNIKNLFAFGETAGTGVHGANRLASNSLLEAVVFSEQIRGAAAARHFFTAAQIARIQKIPAQKFNLPRLQRSSVKDKQKLKKIRRQIQLTMWKNTGVIRSKKSLAAAMRTLNKLARALNKIKSNDIYSVEIKNMLAAALVITKAAMMRKKSMGCHVVM